MNCGGTWGIVTRTGRGSVALRFREENVVGHNLKSRPVVSILYRYTSAFGWSPDGHQLSLAKIPADKFRRVAPGDNIQKIGLPLFRAFRLVGAVHRDPEAGNRDLTLGVTEPGRQPARPIKQTTFSMDISLLLFRFLFGLFLGLLFRRFGFRRLFFLADDQGAKNTTGDLADTIQFRGEFRPIKQSCKAATILR